MRRIDKLMAEAARLRRQYGVDVGTQRAPFFELQTEDFALLAMTPTSCARSTKDNGHGSSARSAEAAASSSWPSWAIRASPAAGIFPRLPKGRSDRIYRADGP
jgi:hypothetical protein